MFISVNWNFYWVFFFEVYDFYAFVKFNGGKDWSLREEELWILRWKRQINGYFLASLMIIFFLSRINRSFFVLIRQCKQQRVLWHELYMCFALLKFITTFVEIQRKKRVESREYFAIFLFSPADRKKGRKNALDNLHRIDE